MILLTVLMPRRQPWRIAAQSGRMSGDESFDNASKVDGTHTGILGVGTQHLKAESHMFGMEFVVLALGYPM